MNLKSYIDLVALLEIDPSTREENRAFALTHPLLKNKPLEQIGAWIALHYDRLKRPLLSETFSSYLYATTFTLVVISFILGLFTGFGLLSYNGSEPVNVIYFMVMVIVFPLVTMLLTVISMFRAQGTHNVLVHISPAFWMEKILTLFPGRVEDNIRAFKLNPLLTNWLIIQRAQVLSLFFSLGLLLALLAMVVTKDIAFAWSTTLHISPEEFHLFLKNIAFPWSEFSPSAVPSMTLIEKSHYFRLGEGTSMLDPEQLGEWWKFLAFATLFYAILLRLLMLFIASFGFKRALKQSVLILEGSRKLLREMNEPLISTHERAAENAWDLHTQGYRQTVNTLDASYDAVQGWAISQDDILVLSDTLGVIAPKHLKVGGSNSLEEDDEVISGSEGEILLLAKSWEHPSNEFLDYLLDLSKKVDKIVIMPLGTGADLYAVKSEDLDEWAKKLSSIENEKVWLKRSHVESSKGEEENGNA